MGIGIDVHFHYAVACRSLCFLAVGWSRRGNEVQAVAAGYVSETYSTENHAEWSGSEPRYPAYSAVCVTEGSGNGETRADFAQFSVRVINFGWVCRRSIHVAVVASSSPPVHLRFQVMPILDMRAEVFGADFDVSCGTLQTGQSCSEEGSGLPVAAKCFHPRPADPGVDPTAAVSSRGGRCADINRHAVVFSF